MGGVYRLPLTLGKHRTTRGYARGQACALARSLARVRAAPTRTHARARVRVARPYTRPARATRTPTPARATRTPTRPRSLAYAVTPPGSPAPFGAVAPLEAALASAGRKMFSWARVVETPLTR